MRNYVQEPLWAPARILGPLWVDLGSIWGRFGGRFWDHFGFIWDAFWDDFGPIRRIFHASLAPSVTDWGDHGMQQGIGIRATENKSIDT